MKSASCVMVLLAACAAKAALVEIPLNDGNGNLLEGVAAYANYFDDARSPREVINGSGLNPDGSCSTENTTMWMGSGKVTTYSKWLVVDLGRETWIDQVKFWNFNLNNGTAYVDRGVKQFDLLASSASSVADLSLPSSVSVGSQNSPAGYDFSNGGWTEIVTNATLAKASGSEAYTGAENVVFAPVKARFLGLRIDSIYSTKSNGTGGYGGLSEMKLYFEEYASFQSVEPIEVGETAATLSATFSLKEGVEGGEVHLVYGTEDGGAVPANWQRDVTVGEACAAGTVEQPVSGLSRNTTYHYAFYCIDRQHCDEPAWSSVGTFLTPASLAAQFKEVASVDIFAATVSGSLLAQSGAAEVFVAYGDEDGGEDPADWDHAVSLGEKSAGDFTAELSGLTANTLYYVAFYVMDADTPVWS